MTTTDAKTKPRHDVRNAWVSLILIPLFLVVADGVLHGLLGLMGIDELADPEETLTLLQSLVAGIPYALVMMLPGIGGFWFGRKAQRNRRTGQRVPLAENRSQRRDERCYRPCDHDRHPYSPEGAVS